MRLVLLLFRVALPLLFLFLPYSNRVDANIILHPPPSAQGGLITTFTMQNDSGATMPAGTPVTFGQAFAYGDVMPGNHPVIVDAATGVVPGQQWDEIDTFTENAGNGSWRHAVWTIWLPTAVAAGATYRVKFMLSAGAYQQFSHQPLSALCSGPAAHDIKIHITDVRNQNDSVRDSGDATFRVCDNIANTGRDAPRHVRAGNVYDEYIVSGMFNYTSGHKDPMLYAQCNMDIFTQAADGVSAGDVRWMCNVHNSWENVSAGSTGNVGNPGPAGFTSDPQMVSYRMEIDDGSTKILDWSGLDVTVSSANNPIVPASANNCNRFGETVCMFVPGSTGPNTWYTGMATRVTSTGSPVAGLNNGALYWVWPAGSAGAADGTNTQYVALMQTPYEGEPFPMINSQGTGTTTFSTRQTHWHFQTLQTLDWTGLDNWSPVGTTTRVTRKVYPALTSTEQRYWEETGIIVPLLLTQPTGQLGPAYAQGLGNNFEPFGQLNVIGGNGGGPRPDLGITNEWAAKAFITQNQTDWDLARLFTYGSPIHAYSTLLDEATGRISPMNNGSPTGPGGNGNGILYTGLGAFQTQQNWLTQDAVQNLAQPLDFVPNGSFHYVGGTNNGGTTLDHMPNFDGFTYIIFGSRHFLDMIWWHANKDFTQQRPGPGPELGQGYYRDNNATFTDGHVYHYWGIVNDSCFQGRGCAWLTRDIAYGATFGADGSPERKLFGDMLKETSNYWPLFLAFRDGPGSTGYSASIYPSGEPDTVDAGSLMDSFVTTYVTSVGFILETWQHLPMSSTWNTKFQRFYEGVCGRQLTGATTIPSFYCIDFNLQPQIHDGGAHQVGFGGNVGQYMNGTDASDFGNFDSNLQILTGGQVAVNGYLVTAGDTLKMINGWFVNITPLDQLADGTRWYVIMGPIDNTQGNRTFYIQCNASDHTNWPAQCPVAGQAFTGFTRGGVAVTNEFNLDYPKLRLSYDPGANSDFVDSNYGEYGGQTINGLAVLGYDVSHATSEFNFRCGPQPNGGGCYNQARPSSYWDSTVGIPGLPTPINSIGGSTSLAPAGAAVAGFTTLALNSDFTQPMPVNWLGGCSVAGDGSPVNTNDNTGHTWWMNIWWSWTYQPCNTVQKHDPVYGTLVLDIPWTVDTNAENVGTVIQSAAWFSTTSTGASGTGFTFPNNAYYELTLRITPVAPGSWGGMFTWPLLAMTDSNQSGLEHDVIELDTGKLGNSDAAMHNWGVSGHPGIFLWVGQGTPGLPTTFDPLQYHKFGFRTTSDGSNLSGCSYVDDVFQSCVTVPGGLTPTEALEREFLIIQNACDYWNYSVPCASGQLQDLYVQKVSVWSCATWATTQCNGSVLNGAP